MKSDPISIAVEPLPQHDLLAEDWMKLEQRAESSYFTSWGWISIWLKSLPASIKPLVLRVKVGVELVGLAILVERRYLRYKVMPVHETYLNSTGIKYLDALMIEHNDVLLDKSLQPLARAMILQKLLANNLIEEFHASGVSTTKFSIDPPPAGFSAQVLARECRGIDLRRVREAGDYLTLISANSRNKIRKAIKECELSGSIRLELAKDLPQAESMYADLCRLHNETWEERGKVGAFDNTYLREFHHYLIKDRFKHGEIQLVAMYCGDILLGVLYNFAYRDQVYNYQSGINYKSGIKNCKPGLLIHALTVKHNAQCDYSYYDLLAGDSQYKRTLATSGSSLHWIVYQPDRWKFRAENRLRLIKRYLSRPLRTEKLPD